MCEKLVNHAFACSACKINLFETAQTSKQNRRKQKPRVTYRCIHSVAVGAQRPKRPYLSLYGVCPDGRALGSFVAV